MLDIQGFILYNSGSRILKPTGLGRVAHTVQLGSKPIMYKDRGSAKRQKILEVNPLCKGRGEDQASKICALEGSVASSGLPMAPPKFY